MRLIDCHVTAHVSYRRGLTSKEDILFNAEFTCGGGRTLKSRWYRYVRSVFPRGGCRDAEAQGGGPGTRFRGVAGDGLVKGGEGEDAHIGRQGQETDLEVVKERASGGTLESSELKRKEGRTK